MQPIFEILLWIAVGGMMILFINFIITTINNGNGYKRYKKSVDELIDAIENEREPFFRIHTYYEIPFSQFLSMYEKNLDRGVFKLFGNYVLYCEKDYKSNKDGTNVYTMFYFTGDSYRDYHEYYIKYQSALSHVFSYVKDDNVDDSDMKIRVKKASEINNNNNETLTEMSDDGKHPDELKEWTDEFKKWD